MDCELEFIFKLNPVATKCTSLFRWL